MQALVWAGTALAVIAGIWLVAMGLRARRSLEAAQTPEATRATLNRMAALNGAAFALGLLGIGLMVVGLILG